MEELLYREATELARLVRDGEVTSRELTEASLARIEEVDGAINAYTLLDAENALAQADAVEAGDPRPFAGVPIAIKDLAAPTAGLRLANGMDLMGEYTPDYDSNVVRRFKQAGFVIVGKTSTPELGILPVTEPRRFGPTRNPWDTERTPGGSSGGAGAAVAAGTVPIAHGSDGGGSIRIPASCCGLVGLKPARGRISRGPDLGEHFLATDGVLTRTTRDTAALLDILAGYESGDANWAPPPSAPFADAAKREPGSLRIGIAYDAPIDAPPSAANADAARRAGELLQDLGHEVHEVENAPWAGTDLLPVFTVLWAATVGLGVAHAQLVTQSEATQENLEPLTWELYQQALGHNAVVYLGSMAQLQAYSRQIVAMWNDLDVLVTPALAQRPVRIGEIDACGENPMYEFKKSGEFTPYTALFNLTGQPAVALPLFEGEDGLPLAVQFAGPPAGEELLLSLSAQLEAARPWAQRRPSLAAV